MIHTLTDRRFDMTFGGKRAVIIAVSIAVAVVMVRADIIGFGGDVCWQYCEIFLSIMLER